MYRRTRRGCERREHAFGVRHLWHAFGIHETRDFDTPQPGALQAAYELDLCRRRQNLRLALQAIARPDFNDLDCMGIHGADCKPWVA